jgi:flagellar motor switch protein FliG
LRFGGARMARVEGLQCAEGTWTGSFVPAAISFENPGLADAEPGLTSLGQELRSLLAEIKTDMTTTLAGLSSAVDTLKQKQEDLDDRLVYGQADMDSHRNFADLATYDVKIMAVFLKYERPQLLALVLSFLEEAQAGALVDLLPVELQLEVIQRLGTLDQTDPELLRKLERVLLIKLKAASQQGQATGGVGKVAGVLNHVSRACEATIIQQLEKIDADFAEAIKRNMFVFEDISLLEPESIAALFERADSRDILIAMKPLNEDLREKLFSLFPPEYSAALRESYTTIGKVRLREADAAGMRIVELVKQLESEGRIFIARDCE